MSRGVHSENGKKARTADYSANKRCEQHEQCMFTARTEEVNARLQRKRQTRVPVNGRLMCHSICIPQNYTLIPTHSFFPADCSSNSAAYTCTRIYWSQFDLSIISTDYGKTNNLSNCSLLLWTESGMFVNSIQKYWLI